tara:strand:- start:826 stop:1044 length:219 start_codon:yes stop_codon:yes gene_type:complete
MKRYFTALNIAIAIIILSVIVAILVEHTPINGAVALFIVTTVPLIMFPFLWTWSIYRRQEKKRQEVMKGKWK